MQLIDRLLNLIGYPQISEQVRLLADELRKAPHNWSYVRGQLRAQADIHGRLCTKVWRDANDDWYIATWGVEPVRLNRREAAFMVRAIEDWWDGYRLH